MPVIGFSNTSPGTQAFASNTSTGGTTTTERSGR
jgi:hypothetical protein